MMKKITLLFFCFSLSIMFGQVPTVDFETNGVDYISAAGAGTAVAVITDNSTNMSMVAELSNSGDQYENYSIALDYEVSFADPLKQVITLDFYNSTDTARLVWVKFEGSGVVPVTVAKTSDAVAGWETLTFDFGSEGIRQDGCYCTPFVPTGSYPTMLVFVDGGISGAASVTRIDNIGGGTQGAIISVPTAALPLDFSSTSDAFTWDKSGGTGGDALITGEKLQIFGNGDNWDNAFINFAGVNQVDLSNNAANTITFTMQSTDAPADEVHTHLFKIITTAGNYETDFTTTGQIEETVFIDPPSPLGNLTELRIFVDRNSAANGVYLVDDIAVFVDSAPPTAFTATVGTAGAFGVELLLNATDDSGSITYDITYNGGANTVQTTGTSGVETSFTVSGLDPLTAYIFEVSASDGTGNVAANNPITGLNATTTADLSNDCAGQTEDYAYTFETLPSGTDVKVTIEILNTVDGLVAQFFNDGNGNQNPTLVPGTTQKFEYTFAGLTDGAVMSFTGGFAWAAGGSLSVSRDYTVGDACTLGTEDFAITSFKAYPNPTQDSWTVRTENSNMSSIKVFDILGKNVLSLAPNASETVIDGSTLKSGLYFAQIKTESGINSIKLIKN